MRISEILKKVGKKTLPGILEPEKEKPVTEERKVAADFSPPFPSPSPLPQGERIKEKVEPGFPPEHLYSEAINLVRKIFDLFAKEIRRIDFQAVKEVVSKIVQKVLANDEQLLILTNKSTPDNYLYAHSVNVCILSLHLASALHWPENKLQLLGITALLHDLGMVRVLPLASKTMKLSSAEYEEIKKHPHYGKELVEQIDGELEKNIKDLLSTVAYQEHERTDGQGYPQGLKDKDLNEFAKIIGLADTYEGLTHPRAYRERMLPHQALKYLIESSQEQFETTLLKAFVEELSFYPLGSFVKLSTEEIAEVVKNNRKFPTRPTVRILIGAHGEKLSTAKLVNLSETPILYIREALDETKLKIPDKELALKLKVRRWWISSGS